MDKTAEENVRRFYRPVRIDVHRPSVGSLCRRLLELRHGKALKQLPYDNRAAIRIKPDHSKSHQYVGVIETDRAQCESGRLSRLQVIDIAIGSHCKSRLGPLLLNSGIGFVRRGNKRSEVLYGRRIKIDSVNWNISDDCQKTKVRAREADPQIALLKFNI